MRGLDLQWRADGLTGQATSDTGPVRVTYDSPPDGSPGVLLGFIEGQDARELAGRSVSDRRAAVLESLARQTVAVSVPAQWR